MKGYKNNHNKIIAIILLVIIFTFMTSQGMEASLKPSLKQNINVESSYTETMWLPIEVISTESNGVSGCSSIAVDSDGNVHVAWSDNTNYTNCGTDADIFYKFWNATSKSWNATEVVSTESTEDSEMPSLAVDGKGNVHIVWYDLTDYADSGSEEDIFYKFWNATSKSWNVTEVVSTESNGYSLYPSLTVDETGNVHVAWLDNTNYTNCGTDADIFYKFWNTTSKSWNATEVVSTESTLASRYPTIAISTSGDVHIAWEDMTNYEFCGTDKDVFYKHWNATSENWSITEVVSTYTHTPSETPTIDIDALGTVHVAWSDRLNINEAGDDYDIWYKQRTAATPSWTTPKTVSTESTDSSTNPSLTVDILGDVHVAWNDYTDYAGAGGNWDIFYKFWNSTSSIWNTTEVVSTVSTDGAVFPAVTGSDEGNIHIVWHDWTNYTNSGTDSDIFYRKLLRLPYPVLDDISPQISLNGNITLNWNLVPNTEKYYVYRSHTPIVSFAGLSPIATLDINNTYDDHFLANGTYYYIVVASNSYLNRSSNEVSVNVILLPSPVLEDILPNPSTTGEIALNWNSVINVERYYIYRSQTPIVSVTGLTPIAAVIIDTFYTDTLTNNGTYYYLVVASNQYQNVSSNEVWVIVELPPIIPELPLQSFFAMIGLITLVPIFRIFKRKKKNE